MKLRIILLLIAIILGAVAVIGVVAYIANIKASVEREVEKVEVLVAAKNILKETPVEEILSTDSVFSQAVPSKYLADGVLTSLDNYKGYVAVAPINKGEQITSTNFIKPEEIGLAFVVPSDTIAVSIPIDEVIGVSNLINVGDRVNVIATFKPSQQQAEAVSSENTEATETTPALIQEDITRTLLWDIEVLYIGTRTITQQKDTQNGGLLSGQNQQKDKEVKITTVTLAVTPEESEKLIFSEELGSVWLALLPTEGMEKTDTPGQTLNSIFK